jgi:hypothetical protein
VTPPPSPPPAVAGVQTSLSVFSFTTLPQRPRAGRLLTASLGVRQRETGATVRSGTIRCTARLAARPLKSVRKGFSGGRAVCAWRIPRWAQGLLVRGSVAVRQGALVERRFSKLVRR